MTLTITKVRRTLARMRFSTVHACRLRRIAIVNLARYERSVAMGGEIDLEALFTVYCQINWLIDHVREIRDKQVTPSQKLFLAQAFAYLFNTYEQQRGV